MGAFSPPYLLLSDCSVGSCKEKTFGACLLLVIYLIQLQKSEFDLFKKFIRDYSLRTGREKQKQLWGSVLCFQPWTQHLRKMKEGNSLVVRWLGLGAFTTGALGSTPGQGTKILQVAQWDQKENLCGPTIMCCLHVSAWGGGTQMGYLPLWARGGGS